MVKLYKFIVLVIVITLVCIGISHFATYTTKTIDEGKSLIDTRGERASEIEAAILGSESDGPIIDINMHDLKNGKFKEKIDVDNDGKVEKVSLKMLNEKEYEISIDEVTYLDVLGRVTGIDGICLADIDLDNRYEIILRNYNTALAYYNPCYWVYKYNGSEIYAIGENENTKLDIEPCTLRYNKSTGILTVTGIPSSYAVDNIVDTYKYNLNIGKLEYFSAYKFSIHLEGDESHHPIDEISTNTDRGTCGKLNVDIDNDGRIDEIKLDENTLYVNGKIAIEQYDGFYDLKLADINCDGVYELLKLYNEWLGIAGENLNYIVYKYEKKSNTYEEVLDIERGNMLYDDKTNNLIVNYTESWDAIHSENFTRKYSLNGIF